MILKALHGGSRIHCGSRVIALQFLPVPREFTTQHRPRARAWAPSPHGALRPPRPRRQPPSRMLPRESRRATRRCRQGCASGGRSVALYTSGALAWPVTERLWPEVRRLFEEALPTSQDAAARMQRGGGDAVAQLLARRAEAGTSPALAAGAAESADDHKKNKKRRRT